MPSPVRFVLNGLSLTKVEKILPKKWTQSSNFIFPNNEQCGRSVETFTTRDSIMIYSLVRSLKEFARQGDLSDAFKSLSLIQQHATSSTCLDLVIGPLSSILLSCTNFKLLSQGQQVHARAISLGMGWHPVLVQSLATFYSAFGFSAEVHKLTSNSNITEPFLWNLLISLYGRKGLYSEVLSVYKEMLNVGVRPDEFTYPLVLKACAETMDTDLGRMVHGSIEATSSGLDLFVQNALISMYGKFGLVMDSQRLFDQMPEKDVVSWNSIVSAYASNAMWDEACDLFDCMMKEGIELNIIILNTIAGACLRRGKYKAALDLISQAKFLVGHVDRVAVILGVGACSHLRAIKLGKELHGLAIRNHFHELLSVRNAMITMYARFGDLRNAHILFHSTESKDIVTWNSILSAYCHLDQSEEASFLFREMLSSGMQPNFITIASILPLCARVANLQHGRELHCYMIRSDCFKDYLVIWNSLVDMYARSGKVSEARKVFEMMEMKDVVTYTNLIGGYGIQGDGLIALRLFKRMIKCGIEPDYVTMIAVLSACSHSGLIVQGEELFQRMQTDYNITPRIEHFDCMVDLFGRAGFLRKAKEIIDNMPFEPTPAIWATLLGACRNHRDTIVGEWAAGKLLELKPDNPGYYVLMANMFADACSWEKHAKVRSIMRDSGVKKAPGCSWIDIGTGYVPFVVEDTSSPHVLQIYSLLDDLKDVMKDTDDDATEEFNAEMVLSC